MKKVLFSSVCAVALLGSNVYAIESNSVGNSLETFLSQKTELENKIKEQTSLITQKQESVNVANATYQNKDIAYKNAGKNITAAIINAGDKESAKNLIEREHTSLVSQGNTLNTQKENLNSEIAGLEASITKCNEDLNLLNTELEKAKLSVTEKQSKYDEALKVLSEKKESRKSLQIAYEDARKDHEVMLEKYNLADEEGKKLIETQLQEKLQAKNFAEQALKKSDNEIAPLAGAKDLAKSELDSAKLQVTNIKNNQTNTTNNKTKATADLEVKNQTLAATAANIEENTKKQIEAKAKLDTAVKTYEEAQAAVLVAKQNQANVKVELDTASENLEKAKQDLLTAQAELDKLNQDLKELEGNIANNTEVGKKSKEEMGENYKASTQELANKLITLSAENNGDLSTATPEVKAQAQAIANEIASVIINEQKSEISSDVLSSLNVSINNMNKRLGEIRGLNEDLGVWFRAYGGRFSNDNSHFNYYSTQIGADKKTDFNNGDLIAGALFGYDKVNSNAKSKGFNVGGYLSYISNDGYFADLVLKYIHTGYDKAGIKSQNSFLASVESGYRFNVYQNTYLEPSLELITGYVGKYEAQIGKNTISTKSYVPLIIKPQVFAGYSVNDFTFRAGVGAILDTKKHTANILINDLVKGINASSSVKLDSNNRGFVSLGGSYKFNDNLRLNLSIERSFGSSLTNDYEINSTIRYTF
ncbi:autotransporter outer membrane beta-barrel domain-containing protein [Campylobacter sp. Cr9]|uniref:autotransporter outer membrane beta-barrel domain-containing protein n=1 Tax=Campylobacter sp. Cr9 TaxID=2735728 RepID=UPI00301496CB|nr:autotransporter outer membrane beta-barrel domain-containing protein [Campylobacter sp. Cr9]